VKSKSEKLFEIREIQENLETRCSKVDNLENLSSRSNNKNGELQVVTTKEESDVGSKQEQRVYTFF
jgi:hypothetical protein